MRWEGIAHLIIIWNLGIINVIIIVIISMWSQSFSFRKEYILVLILFSSRVIERDSIARIKPYFFCVASFIFLLEAFRSQREPDMNGKAAEIGPSFFFQCTEIKHHREPIPLRYQVKVTPATFPRHASTIFPMIIL